MLACASAAGEVFPPLFIFKGKNFQTIWKGQNALQGNLYACNESGWMETDMFYTWLQKFVFVVTLRPLLLLVDGHVSHISGELIKLAIENDVTLFELPPHVTDVLQPLDMTCFGPLQSKWEKVMNKWGSISGSQIPLSKAMFGDELCCIWKESLSEANIKSGFSKTVVFSVDATKYPVECFDTTKLKRYNLWLKKGKDRELLDVLTVAQRTPKKLKPEDQLQENTIENLQNEQKESKLSARTAHNCKFFANAIHTGAK